MIDPKKGLSLNDFETTKEIIIPRDPLERVIGQDEAIKIAKIAAMQHRHLLLVGPPGTGKSMIAQALALHLKPPTEEIRVVHNPQNPERPFVEVKNAREVEAESMELRSAEGKLIDPREAPEHVAIKLGFKCAKCGTYSSPSELVCPKCGTPKVSQTTQGPFADIFGALGAAFGIAALPPRVTTTVYEGGVEKVIVYERDGDKIRVFDEKALEKRRALEKKKPYKVIVPLKRNPFVMATGASETELLGDVKHDPYGGHPQLGTPPYKRVVAGAIHEAHQGVLFVDEITHLGPLQRNILTAMQEKKFSIAGRNPQSAGASVRVDDVPCDFILVAACNIQDVPNILSPLRSRIIGEGYEVLVNTTMPDTEENRAKYVQFVAQEIASDGRIPHATRDAVLAIIEEGRRRAKAIDNETGLTLRLREMGGLIRAAGDLAVYNGDRYIERKHVEAAIKLSKPVEEQIRDRYGAYEAGVARDVSASQRTAIYNYWNESDIDGYQ
ncbi:putative ATP-dependent protease [Aciduliprofundum sp. MAR08-339]|uniref:ATP-binding protein n=1 Tax=Aciduliprofundum sp. (strain MAR08-339) TaxID=673860 RepID=UPI0002A49FEC|nr:putative ATP-dependent protease [Aciduliprofundum sp. MAR08-339]